MFLTQKTGLMTFCHCSDELFCSFHPTVQNDIRYVDCDVKLHPLLVRPPHLGQYMTVEYKLYKVY